MAAARSRSGRSDQSPPRRWESRPASSGRIWVMWGNAAVGGGVAVTRSNMAVTRFEPIQRLKLKSGSLYRLSGDGRLGPLDLLVDQIPDVSPIQPAGSFYGRVLPELSASHFGAQGQRRQGSGLQAQGHRHRRRRPDLGCQRVRQGPEQEDEREGRRRVNPSVLHRSQRRCPAATAAGYNVLTQTVHI